MRCRALLSLGALLLCASVACGVSPLVTDDADTVEPGRLEIDSDFTFLRTAATTLYSIPITAVIGLLPSLEFSTSFGYQWRRDSGTSPRPGDADTFADLTIGPKFRLGDALGKKLRFSGRIDLKLPTASDRRSLGTGKTDAGFVGIATYDLQTTSFDFNVGYYAVDLSQAHLDNDRWFVGETVRQALGKNWNVLAETYASIPNTSRGGRTAFYFSGGVGCSLTKSLSITALVGTATGHDSPDLTGTFEIASQF